MGFTMSASQRVRAPYLLGFAGGLASFVVGYLLTYLWRGRDIERLLGPTETLLALFQAEPLGTWRVVGWLFYGAHFVDTRIAATFGPVDTAVYVDLVREGSGNLELLYLLPPALLIVAGFLVVTRLGAVEFVDGARFGALITIGYFPLIAAGLVLFAYHDTRPDPVPAILVAGLLYPIVFGALGGLLGAALGQNRRA